MTDTAERIAKLAERLDPMPHLPMDEPSADFDQWCEREAKRLQALAIATPGAQLRRLVVSRQSGVEWRDCASMMGIELSSARRWFNLLPDELKG